MKLLISKSVLLVVMVSVCSFSVLADETESKEMEVSNPIEAIVQIPVTGIKVASGIAALPLIFAGEIGSVSSQAGYALLEHASSSNNKVKQPVASDD
jgi:uncharacterized SAM-binding protein YcdF (DUF218 family)